MRIVQRDVVMGVLFGMLISLLINYNNIERMFVVGRVEEFNDGYMLLFSLVWYFALSLLYYLVASRLVELFHGRRVVQFITVVGSSILLILLFRELYPDIRELLAPEDNFIHKPIRRLGYHPHGPNFQLFNHILVVTFNLLLIYIIRLISTNQDIARRNELLELETVKSQHHALVQQINPHFFFNSLNSLRYTILKGDGDMAVSFLDNLTVIFRKTLMASDKISYTLAEEMELALSYVHILERRFEGKFMVEISIDDECRGLNIVPLSLITLIENVVKHNTIGSRRPMQVRIYTTDDRSLVVENIVVPRFEERVESSGIGLKNLNQRYMLLIGRGVEVVSSGEHFAVTLPLIEKV